MQYISISLLEELARDARTIKKTAVAGLATAVLTSSLFDGSV